MLDDLKTCQKCGIVFDKTIADWHNELRFKGDTNPIKKSHCPCCKNWSDYDE